MNPITEIKASIPQSEARHVLDKVKNFLGEYGELYRADDWTYTLDPDDQVIAFENTAEDVYMSVDISCIMNSCTRKTVAYKAHYYKNHQKVTDFIINK